MRAVFEYLPPEVIIHWRAIAGEDIASELAGKIYTPVEYFCINLSCHCQSAVIDMTELDANGTLIAKPPIARIACNWSNKLITDLLPDEEQSPYASEALTQFRSQILSDHEYVRVKIYYDWVRMHSIIEQTDPQQNTPRKSNVEGRNQRCPCGSGKKYKKCCMYKD